MAWRTEGDDGVITCDTPGCPARLEAATAVGACFDAVLAGWHLVDGRTRADNCATCPECLAAQDEARGVVRTAVPWAQDGPEQGTAEPLGDDEDDGWPELYV